MMFTEERIEIEQTDGQRDSRARTIGTFRVGGKNLPGYEEFYSTQVFRRRSKLHDACRYAAKFIYKIIRYKQKKRRISHKAVKEKCPRQ
jgi:hypothetical protein